MIEARITNDLKLILYDTDQGKAIKTFPKKGTDTEKRLLAEEKFKKMKQSICLIISNRIDLLKKQFLSGEEISNKEWTEDYLKNPVLMRIAQLLVWKQESENQTKYFSVFQGNPVCSDGSSYSLLQQNISLAHPVEMSEKQVLTWQNYLLKRNLRQPFAQVWEPIGLRDQRSVLPDRYNGGIITVGYILGLKRQGFVRYNYASDCPTSFVFTGSMAISGQLEKQGYWFEENGPGNSITLGKIEYLREEKPRYLNHVLACLDRVIIPQKIRADDDAYLLSVLPGKTRAQIAAFLQTAMENRAAHCTAVLLDYQNSHFREFSDVTEFTLD